MKIEKIKKEKLVILKENIKDSRQKSKITYKICDIVVEVILAVLSDSDEWTEIEDFANDKKDFF